MPVPDALRRCAALAERFRENPLAQAQIGLAIGLLEAADGNLDRARRLCAASEQQYAELGYRLEEAQAAARSAKVEAYAGNLPAAERKLREACATFTNMGERSHFSSRAAELAEVLWAQGQDEEAERFTRLSEEATSSDDVEAQALWRAVRAKVLARRGEPTAAERLAREADTLAQTSDDLELQGDTLTALGEVLRHGGTPDDAASRPTRRAQPLRAQRQHHARRPHPCPPQRGRGVHTTPRVAQTEVDARTRQLRMPSRARLGGRARARCEPRSRRPRVRPRSIGA
jgi:ATP/maltotriose-dependent transcriptional regulator MalT